MYVAAYSELRRGAVRSFTGVLVEAPDDMESVELSVLSPKYYCGHPKVGRGFAVRCHHAGYVAPASYGGPSSVMRCEEPLEEVYLLEAMDVQETVCRRRSSRRPGGRPQGPPLLRHRLRISRHRKSEERMGLDRSVDKFLEQYASWSSYPGGDAISSRRDAVHPSCTAKEKEKRVKARACFPARVHELVLSTNILPRRQVISERLLPPRGHAVIHYPVVKQHISRKATGASPAFRPPPRCRHLALPSCLLRRRHRPAPPWGRRRLLVLVPLC